MTGYAWSGPGGFTADTECITIGTAGTYEVIITDANGCADTCSRTLTVYDQPTCEITGGSDQICAGFTTDWCATAGMTSYAWSGPGGFTADTECITIGIAGTYEVIITDANGCADTCSRTLTVYDQPTCEITGGSDGVCAGLTTDWCATAGMTSYAWTGPGGFTAATQCITIGTAGTYEVIITDANGCADTCSRTLTVYDQPSCEITGGSDQICAGFTTDWCATSGMTGYAWSGPGGFTADTECITIGTAGTYEVIITDANGCADTCSRTLVVYDQPTCEITGGSDQICAGFTTDWCATSGMTGYAWSGPGGFTADTECITIGTAGTYEVIITDANGCADTCSRTLVVHDRPTCDITGGEDTVCVDTTTNWCAKPDGMRSYRWSGPAGFSSTDQCIDVGAGLLPGTYIYQVIVTDFNDCADTCSGDLTVEQCEECCPSVWIGTVDCVNPGDYVTVPIYLECIPAFGGFELEVEFDYTSMCFVSAERGGLLNVSYTDQDGIFWSWEYFTYRVLRFCSMARRKHPTER
jgi:hypothetical protein